VDRFRRTASPVAGDLVVGVWVGGLPPLVFHQLMYGIQRAITDGVRLKRADLSAVCGDLRRAGVADLRDATPTKTLARRFVEYTVSELGAGLGDRDQQLEDDAWNLRLWGRGNTTLEFGVIVQPWLRQGVKQWIATGLARDLHTSHLQRQIGALVRFSDHLARVAPVATPADLDQRAKERFLAELRLDEAAGLITSYVRNALVRNLGRFLREAASTGMCDPSGPLAGMAGSFQIRPEEIPKRRSSGDPEDEIGRSLPEAIIAQLLSPANLGMLTPMWERLVRIAIDTGRRPDELCRLRLDCVDHDLFVGGDGTQQRLPVLVHDQPKVKRTGVRLPISSDTATTIADQQAAVRAEHPDTPPDQLALFPRRCRNPFGTKATNAAAYGSILATWRDSGLSLFDAAIGDGKIEPILGAGDQVTRFPNEAIFAYAFRHTYAQRHIDAGVAVPVLAELMGHTNINTTQAYYRIRTQQKREALDKVTRFQMTIRGTVLGGPASASDAQRMEVGSISTPMGSCVEPSNVKAHGRACAYRHRCFGCAHFRTDVSHLPELRAYLNQLLVAREELADANPDIAEWARREAMPSDDEISTVRRLIDACDALVDKLPAGERQELNRHIETLRESRQHLVDAVPVTFLGNIAQTAPTVFPAIDREVRSR
jgi:integrase